MKTERRFCPGIEIREAQKDSGILATLTGIAAPFNSDSRLMRSAKHPTPFVERIAPGAFARSLKESRHIFALWDHDLSRPLGRFPQTLRLSEDAKGLRYEMDIPDTQLGRDTLTEVRRGTIDGVSVGFYRPRDQWRRDGDKDVRTLLDVDLEDVSLTVKAAYEDTTIAESRHARFVEACSTDKELRSLTLDADDAVAATEKEQPPQKHFSVTLWEKRTDLLTRK